MLLAEFLTKPELIDRLPIAPAAQEILKAFGRLVTQIGATLLRVAEAPPSPGYEPYLTALNCNPIAARGLATIAFRSGQRQANDARQQRGVVAAIRFLAKAGRQRHAALLRARTLLSAWENSSVIEEIFADLRCDESEFIRLLKSVVETRGRVQVPLREIAADVALQLSCRRGPKISARAIAHELFMQNVAALTKRKAPAFTWSSEHEDFIDPLTWATRWEFSDHQFNPRTARQRAKAREDKRARSS
jgi:hypothetical protein